MTSATAPGIIGSAFLGMAKSQGMAAAPISARCLVRAPHGSLVWLRVCALPSSCAFFQRRLGLLQVCRIKPLGEPAIDRRQQLVGFRTPVLLLPQARQAHSGAQLQGLGLLAAGDVQGALEAGFRLLWLWHRLPQEQDATEAI